MEPLFVAEIPFFRYTASELFPARLIALEVPKVILVTGVVSVSVPFMNITLSFVIPAGDALS